MTKIEAERMIWYSWERNNWMPQNTWREWKREFPELRRAYIEYRLAERRVRQQIEKLER